MTFSYKKIAATVIAATLIIAIILILIAYRMPHSDKTVYTLKEYKGTVALYKNDDIITVYDGVVLSSLPRADRQRFYDGMTVKDPQEAEAIIEDYDG